MSSSTLLHTLRERAAERGDALAFTFLVDGERREQQLTYAELDRRARAIAVQLSQTCQPGARALLLYAPDLEYICGFLGCIYAGVVAVPAYPPHPARLERSLPRLRAIAADASASVVLSTVDIRALAELMFTEAPELSALPWIVTNDEEVDAEPWRPPALNADSIAFIQYTSGSTGVPKGVVLTHENLLHNIALSLNAFGAHKDSLGLSWLPPYHDMGLIGAILGSLTCAAHSVLMSPISFLQRPVRWLEGISRYRATISGGPNFAYELCMRRATPEDLERLDLTSWDVAFTGAEPVRRETLERFAAMFARCGFRRQAFYPCYGLAEATLIVSGGRQGSEPVIAELEPRALEQGRAVHSPGGRSLVGCGTSLGEQIVRIVDPERPTALPDRTVGEICVSGPSVARAYWQRDEDTMAAFRAQLSSDPERTFLRTGDLGFLDGGQLFVTGRLKDLIIIRGRNLYPQDVEKTAEESHPALRRGCAAAFAMEIEGEEALVVAVELERRFHDRRQQNERPVSERRGTDRRSDPAELSSLYTLGAVLPGPSNLEPICEQIRRAVARDHDVRPRVVVLVKAGGLPKTSSGKTQRFEARMMLEAGTLPILSKSFIEASMRAPMSSDPDLELRILETTSPRDRVARVATYLRTLIADGLRVPPSAVPLDVPVTTLGLDSLTAVEIAHDIETRFGALLPATALLRDGTIADLAHEVTERLDDEQVITVRRHGAPDEPFGLSPGQEALWFLHQLAPGSTAYNVNCALSLTPGIAEDELERAVRAVVSKHDVLRARFLVGPSGQPEQQLTQSPEVAFEVFDAERWSDDELRAHVADAAHRPFDLERGPLLRVSTFRRRRQCVLLLSSHHIAVDFWSMTQLLDELRGALSAVRQGGPLSLRRTPPMQYRDFIEWQRKYLKEKGERHWEYWRSRLADSVSRVDLPTDRPRPPQQSFRGSSHHFALSAELAARVRDVARQHGTTAYVVLLSAFQLVLGQLSGLPDIAVGTPAAGRTRAEFARLIGLLINPIVIRTDISGAPTFRQLVQRVRTLVLDGLDHQGFPFLHLVQRLKPQRDPARSPLFDVMFAYEQAPSGLGNSLSQLVLGVPGTQTNWDDLTVQSFPIPVRAAQFDLTLMMNDNGAQLFGWIQYCSDLFEPATIEQFAARYLQTLDLACREPDLAVTQLTPPTAPELENLDRWNADARAVFPSDKCLHELVEAQVDRTPNRPAVSCGGDTLSYGELESSANRLARRLRRLGASGESIVGVFLERGVHLVTAHLGILKSGAAFLPLDPEFPTERLLFMIEDSGADILVSSSALAPRLMQDVDVELINIHASDLETESDERPSHAGGPDQLAYVLYTSGSTGRPKGVLVHHGAVVNFLTSMQRIPGLSERDVLGAPTTTSFDISNLELFLPLTVGASVVLLGGEEVRDARLLHDSLKSRGVTVMQATPSLWSMLLGVAKPTGVRALCGGEALPRSLASALLQSCPAVYNLYGPTETTIWSTLDKLSLDDPAVLLGRPIANTTVYVLDEQLQRVPPGVYGEIYIGGAGVARGYLRRPELTAQSFLPDAFARTAGARLYRTGDRGRFRSDGRLEYLGRRDAQVKIRGYRIELGEIEAVLSSHQAVREAAVVVIDPHAGPVGFVTAAPPKRIGPAELRQFVRQQLPAYMVPARIDILERMPRTANNKIDRKALAAMAAGTSPVHNTPPRNETERQIAKIFEEVLQRAGIGIEEDFFALGGHSLMATQVTARLGDAFGFPIPIRALFEAPTIALLAEWIATTKTKESGRTGGALFGPIPRSTRRKISVSGLEEASPSTRSGSEKVRGR